MSQILLNYPEQLIGLNSLNNIAMYDTILNDNDDYKFYLYLLWDRENITAIESYTTIDNDFYTKITMTDTSLFNIGELVYLLDESNAQIQKSNQYTIVEKLSNTELVISRPPLSDESDDLTLNHVVSYNKFPNYKDQTANFILDNNLFDLKLNTLTSMPALNGEGYKNFYTVMTYESKKIVADSEFTSIVYEETLTGLDNPWIEIVTSDPNEVNITKGDIVTFDMGNRQRSDCNLDFKGEIQGDTTIYYLVINRASESWATNVTTMIQVGQSIKLEMQLNTSGNPFTELNGYHTVKDVIGDDIIFFTTLSDTLKDALSTADPSYLDSVRIYFPALARKGTYNVLNTRVLTGKYRLQINAKGLGIPTSETSAGSGLIIYNRDFDVSAANKLTLETNHVTKNNEINLVNSNVDDLSDRVVIYANIPILGPNIIINGDFSDNLYDWSFNGGGTVNVTNGSCILGNNTGSFKIYQDVGTTVTQILEFGKRYKISYEITANTNVTDFRFLGNRLNNTGFNIDNSIGTHAFSHIPQPGDDLGVTFGIYNEFTAIAITNIQVQEVSDLDRDKALLFNLSYSDLYNVPIEKKITKIGFNDIMYINWYFGSSLTDNYKTSISTIRIDIVDTDNLIKTITYDLNLSELRTDSTGAILGNFINVPITPALILESGEWLDDFGFPVTINEFDNATRLIVRALDWNGTDSAYQIYIDLEDVCTQYEKIRLLYNDKFGSLVGLNFTLGNTETKSYKDSTYERNNYELDNNYKLIRDNYRGGTNIVNKEIITSYQLISDWIPEWEVAFFEDCFDSTQYFLQIEDNLDFSAIQSCIIKDKSFTKKTTAKDGLIQYIVNVEINDRKNYI